MWIDATADTPNREIVGRSAERARLAELLGGLLTGSSFTVTVEGEPGSGKTTLLTELAALARGLGIAVRSAAADPVTAQHPLTTAVELSGAGDVVAADSITALLVDEQHRASAADVLADRLLDLAQPGPLLVLIDDGQWLDDWSAHAIELVDRRGKSASIGVVVAHRPHPIPTALARLRSGLATNATLHLEPLTDEEVGLLAALRLGVAPGDGLQVVLRAANGNPFLVEAAIASLRSDDALIEAADVIEIRDAAVPTVNLSRWFTDADDQFEHVLGIASLLGRGFTITELASASDRSAVTLVDPVTAALRSGLLIEADNHLAFRHDLVRDALYDSIPHSVRTALHREVAAREEARGAEPARVAEQLVRAGAPEDRGGVDLLVRTADRLPPSMAPLALTCRQLALDGPIDGPDATRLRVDLATALLSDGRPNECRQLLERELKRPHDIAAGIAYRQLLASALYTLDRYGDASAVLTQLPDGHHPYRALSESAAFLLRGDLAGAASTARLRRNDIDVPESTRILLIGLEAQARAMQGHTMEGLALATEGVQWFERAGRPPDVARFMPYALMAHLVGQADAPADVVAARLAEARETCERDGVRWMVTYVHALHAEELFRRGRWDEAESHAETGVMFIDEGVSRVAGRFLLSVLAQLRLRTGRAADAARLIERAAQEPVEGSASGIEWQFWTQALVASRESGAAAACAPLHMLASIVEAFDAVERLHLVAPFAVASAKEIGDVALAEKYASMATRLSERSGAASTNAAALLAQALLADDIALAREALDAYEGCNRPLEHADAIARTAVLLARRNHHVEARSTAADAISRLDSIGAVADSTQLVRDLRKRGVTVKLVRAERPQTGWPSLTQAERRVVELVGEGRTNADIADRLGIGRRTVETHLYRTFTKLSVTSRTELALVAARHAQP